MKTFLLPVIFLIWLGTPVWSQEIELIEPHLWNFFSGKIDTDTLDGDGGIGGLVDSAGAATKFSNFSFADYKKDKMGIYDPSHFAFSVDEGDERMVRIGNYEVNSQTDMGFCTFQVPASGAFMLYLHVCILVEDPDHPKKEQPSFYIGIWQNRRAEKCTEFFDFASPKVFDRYGGSDKFTSESGVPLYRSRWIPVALDLRRFAGKTLTLKLRVNDCRQGAHFAAMFAKVKLVPNILTVKWCAGENGAVVSAPAGFSKYKWSTGQHGQTIRIQNPTAGMKINCDARTVSDCPASFDAVLIQKKLLPFQLNVQPPVCPGDQGLITIEPKVESFRAFINGSSFASAAPKSTLVFEGESGTYKIRLENDSLCQTQTVEIPKPQGVNSVLTPSDYHGFQISCFGMNTGFLQLNNSGGKPPFLTLLCRAVCRGALTSSLDTIGQAAGSEVRFENLPAGVYHIWVMDSSSCPTHLQIELRQPEVFVVNAVPMDALCHGMPGSIELNSTGGTGSVAELEIFNHRTKTISFDSLFAGRYVVRGRDANECTSMDSFVISEPERLRLTSRQIKILGLTILVLQQSGGTGRFTYTIKKFKRQRPALLFRFAFAFIPGMSATIEARDRNQCPCEEKMKIKRRLKKFHWNCVFEPLSNWILRKCPRAG